MSARRAPGEPGDIGVIGLGRFGGEVAESLCHLGKNVLAIDDDLRVVQHWAQTLTHVVQADSTDDWALRQLGLDAFPRVVVAIGASVEASILTVLALVELGVPEIWARATSAKHARILTSVGAQHVVFPEADMGERVAHLIISKMLDFVEFDTDFAIAKTRTPIALIGHRLGDLGVRDRYGVMVLGVKAPGARFVYANPDMVLPPDGVLIVEGTIDQVQRFAGLT